MPRTPPRPPTDRTPTGIAGDVDALLAAAGAGRRRPPPSPEPAEPSKPTLPPRQEAPCAEGPPRTPHPVRPDATPLGLTRAEWHTAAEQLQASSHTHRVGVILASHLDGWPCPEDAAELRAYAAEVASSDWRRVEAAMRAGPPVAGSPAWLDTHDEAARAALAAAAREGLPMIAEDKNRQRARDARAWAAIVEAAPILARVAGRRSP